MTPFTQQIEKEILADHPEWASLVTYETYKNSEPFLVISVTPPPESKTELPLRISTWDDEVRVDFDHYNAHFERWTALPGDKSNVAAALFVDDVLNERVDIASWWQGELRRVCSQHVPGTPLKISVPIAFSRVRVRSWKGTYSEDIVS